MICPECRSAYHRRCAEWLNWTCIDGHDMRGQQIETPAPDMRGQPIEQIIRRIRRQIREIERQRERQMKQWIREIERRIREIETPSRSLPALVALGYALAALPWALWLFVMYNFGPWGLLTTLYEIGLICCLVIAAVYAFVFALRDLVRDLYKEFGPPVVLLFGSVFALLFMSLLSIFRFLLSNPVILKLLAVLAGVILSIALLSAYYTLIMKIMKKA